jgi:hypothetical protein
MSYLYLSTWQKPCFMFGCLQSACSFGLYIGHWALVAGPPYVAASLYSPPGPAPARQHGRAGQSDSCPSKIAAREWKVKARLGHIAELGIGFVWGSEMRLETGKRHLSGRRLSISFHLPFPGQAGVMCCNSGTCLLAVVPLLLLFIRCNAAVYMWHVVAVARLVWCRTGRSSAVQCSCHPVLARWLLVVWLAICWEHHCCRESNSWECKKLLSSVGVIKG